ncbi:unnamed protein product [Paramecium sonneborni]|uniref:Uncharacterized protein n=1 Tax=Paramecium sonneborni TaxID=65129 RepID=A0A8S1K7T0_9CILI|nr:unnamed protein product [Paramecium sonneborni]
MTESDFSQFLFEQHDPKKFYKYEEIKNHKGFRLPNEKESTIYLQDDDGGWCDLNGCYYNSEGQPSGWIVLSKDGKKYMKFNMNTCLIQENQNIYYSNNSYDAAISEQYLKQYRKNQEQQQQQQKNQKEFRKQQNRNQDPNKKQQNKNDEQQVLDCEKVKSVKEKAKGQAQIYNEEKINQKDNPKKDQTDKQQNQRNMKKNNKKNKQKKDENQNNSELNKYYILNINENALSKDQFIKYLIEEYKIKEKDILEYNEENIKLAQEKDAITLYRINQKEQVNKVQKFIVST